MCELILVNTSDPVFNKFALLNLLIQDAPKNQDGAGFYCPGGTLFKTNLAANNLLNLGELIQPNIKNNNPIIGHVRNASWINKTKLLREHSHPFETDKLVFAHNGTLTRKVYKKDDPTLMDSQIFLNELDALYTGNNMVEALQKAYALFDGKFAFLIYSKIEKNYYVVRGETATLFTTTIQKGEEIIGYVINTEKEDLKDGLLRTINNLGAFSRYSYRYSADIKEIKKNTIFKANPLELEEVAELKESKRETTCAITAEEWEAQSGYWDRGTYVKYAPKAVTNSFLELTLKIKEVLCELSLTLNDLDKILFVTRNCGIMGASIIDFRFVYETILLECKKNFDKYPKFPIYWRSIRESELDPYNKYKIQFPYYLHNYIEIKDLAKALDKSTKDVIPL
jgi:predicted glutamine amidotransferase